MAVKQLPTLSEIPEPPNRLVGDQERFDVLTFNSLKAQEKMVNDDLNKTLIPALNQFAVDVNASVDAAKASETLALASKNAAASSAATATTKAGEAAASATAAKASETSALASKNAAGISAATASNAQKAAEAARDEAQDLANVGYASEAHAGLAKVDGKTTQADAGGVITVKDVAIGGDLGDLASARGQIGNSDRITTVTNLNTYVTSGNWMFSSSAAAGENFPNIGRGGELICYASATAVYQYFIEFLNNKMYIRYYDVASATWSNWVQFVSVAHLGDGIRTTQGIISVPEYEGATASTAGTSGLVPPATAGQQESFLTGGGEYKPALTKISDSVSLADSTTAASAKAVKTAYDLATTARNDANSKVTAAQAANAAMPGRYIDVSYDSNRTYQAPADGYFLITSTESGNTGLYVYDSANATLLYQSFIMGSSGYDNSVMLPVKKSNYIRSVGTYVASKIKHYRFIYAEGNV